MIFQQFLESHDDPSEIILICYFLLLMLKTFVLLNIFGESSKDLFKIEIFCNIINGLTVTFDQYNVPLLNKSFF